MIPKVIRTIEEAEALVKGTVDFSYVNVIAQ
jgi:hypothetical protein